MEESQADPECRHCGARPACHWIDGLGPWCIACLSDRAENQWGRLPGVLDPRRSVAITGGDGQLHALALSHLHAPPWRVVMLKEIRPDVGKGYEFSVAGGEDDDPAELIGHLVREAATEIGRRYLQQSDDHSWSPTGPEIAGRITWDDDIDTSNLIVDGRPLSWTDLGRCLETFEGWRFRIFIEDPTTDRRDSPWPQGLGKPAGPSVRLHVAARFQISRARGIPTRVDYIEKAYRHCECRQQGGARSDGSWSDTWGSVVSIRPCWTKRP